MAAKQDPLVIDDPALPKGSWVTITGVNGFIASHVADQLLAIGYKVRGTVRNVEKAKWMKELFSIYPKENFELVSVPDITADGAFDSAVKDVAGVLHIASPVEFSGDPNKVVPIAVKATETILKSVGATPSVKRFVLTSSSTAGYTPHSDVEDSKTSDDWNEEAVKDAWAPPPYNLDRAYQVYSASKTQGEQAMWKWYGENKDKRPDLVLNSVLPNANSGTVLDFKNQGLPSTIGLFKPLYDGKLDEFMLPPQYYIDVQDTARLHVAALLLKDVKEERIWGFAKPYDTNSVLGWFRKAAPNKKFIDDLKVNPRHRTKVPNDRAEELLRKLGRKGWVGPEESFASMVKVYEQAA